MRSPEQLDEQSAPDWLPPQAISLTMIGLGKMGGNMAIKLAEGGFGVAGYDPSPEARAAAEARGVHVFDSLEAAIHAQENPGERVIWQMLPAGKDAMTGPTEQSLAAVQGIADKGDIIIDGGNSHYKDTRRRYERMKELGFPFLDIGVSGGIIAAATGYPLMVGGDKDAYDAITPILDELAQPLGQHTHFGKSGTGHFVKMVHNGIEYIDMAARGLGAGVLEAAGIDPGAAMKLYSHNTIISGFLTNMAASAYAKDPTLSRQSGVIGSASGEALWTVEAAKELGVPYEMLEMAIELRRQSAVDPAVSGTVASKLTAALREEFGGHDNNAPSFIN